MCDEAKTECDVENENAPPISRDQGTTSNPQDMDVEKADVNPVLQMPIMQITSGYFNACRSTPDGMVSVLDAIRIFMADSPREAKDLWRDIQQSSTKTSTINIGTKEEDVNSDSNDETGGGAKNHT